MLVRSLSLAALVLLSHGSAATSPAIPAWPHRAIITSIGNKPVAFRAYTLGGTFIIAVDRAGNLTSTPAATPSLRPLTAKDTISAETPGNFPLDLSKGPVVFVASDSVHLVVGRNPYGNIDQVAANGRRFTVRLVDDRFVIDSK
jgi:hypothetical protein